MGRHTKKLIHIQCSPNISDETKRALEKMIDLAYEQADSIQPRKSQCGCCGGGKNVKEGNCQICRNWLRS